jgi:hypothetical protein
MKLNKITKFDFIKFLVFSLICFIFLMHFFDEVNDISKTFRFVMFVIPSAAIGIILLVFQKYLDNLVYYIYVIGVLMLQFVIYC